MSRSGGGSRSGPTGRVVANLRDRRPVWAMPDWAVDELEEALPKGMELVVPSTFADGSGDGAGGVPEEVLEVVRGARIYMGYGVPPAVLRAGEGTLEWVHSGAAGVGSSLHPEMLRSGVRFTNSAGIHGPPMAETVLGMILHFFRGLDFALASQGAGRWNKRPFLAADTPVRELAGSTVGILGYGGIGREVARRVVPLGARVLGLRRSPGAVEETGVEALQGEEGMARLLAESDVLVVAAPETEETRGILSRARIRSLRPGTVVVNVSRGSLVDEEALVEALRDGHLRGAGLDVYATEPLPEGHPLWELPNVLLTPHVSAVTRGFWRREMDLILENLRSFLTSPAGPLRNEVDREAGY